MNIILRKYGFLILSTLLMCSAYGSEKASTLVDEVLRDASTKQKTKRYESTDVEYNKIPCDCYELSISFSGAAFRFPWHLGVAAYLQQHYNDKLKQTCFLGASAGAMISTLLACDVKIARDVMGIKTNNDYTPDLNNGKFQYQGNGWLDDVYEKIEHKTTGVYFNIFNAMRTVKLANNKPLLPDDAADLASNRATFSLTNISSCWPRNQRINQFGSREDLMDYGFASGHIPFLVDGNFSTTVLGEKYIDGGITDNQPIFNDKTIQISPYMDSWWGTAPLSWLSLYGTTDMSRNRSMYEDGYNFAAKNYKGMWNPIINLQNS